MDSTPIQVTSLSRFSRTLRDANTGPAEAVAIESGQSEFALVAQALLPVHLFARLNERSAHHAQENPR